MNNRNTRKTTSLLRWSLSLLLLVLISNAFGQQRSITATTSANAICPGGLVTLSYTENNFSSLGATCRDSLRVDTILLIDITNNDTLLEITKQSYESPPIFSHSPQNTTVYEWIVTRRRPNNSFCPSFPLEDALTVEVRNPQASFTWVGPSPNNCANEGPVNFTSNSSGQGLTYAWDFDDGNSSTVRNPNHQYTSVGIASSTYNVTLTITDDAGCSSSNSQNLTIQQSPNAQFNISYNVFDTCSRPWFDILFANQSTTGQGLTYAWDFGTLPAPTGSVSSYNPGSVDNFDLIGSGFELFPVQLIVTNTNNQCQDLITIDAKVYRRPDVSFTLPNEVCAGDTFSPITLNSAGGITDFDWRVFSQPSGNFFFPSSTPSITLETEYRFGPTFIGNGPYNSSVNLIVRNSFCSWSYNQNITVNPSPDTGVNFTQGDLKSCNQTLPVPISLQYDPRTTDTFSYSINWGDGTIESGIVPDGGNLQLNDTLDFNGYSSFDFQVVNSFGCSLDREISYYVGSNPANGLSSLGNTQGICIPDSVGFLLGDIVNNTPGTEYTYTSNASYIFGSFSQDSIPDTLWVNLLTGSCDSIVQTLDGNLPDQFGLSLTASNPCGSTPAQVASITTGTPPNGEIEIIDSFICLGDVVEVWSNDSTRSVRNPDDGCLEAEVRWQISPPANVNLNEPDVVSLNNFEPLSYLTSNFDVDNDRLRFTPPDTGVYRFVLLLGNFCDTISADTLTICVADNPEANILFSDTIGCAPLAAAVTNNSVENVSCAQNTYLWEATLAQSCGFPEDYDYDTLIDGTPTSSTSEEPAFVFNNPGIYSIKTTINNGCGVDSTVGQVTVQGPPVANIVNIPDSCELYTIEPQLNLTNTCFANQGLSEIWDYGSLSPPNAQGRIEDIAAGSYTISLALGNLCETINLSENFTVTEVPDTPQIAPINAVCVGNSVVLRLLNSAANGNSVTYSWTGPNGFATSQDSFVFDEVSLSDTGWYVLEVSIGGCSAPKDSVYLQVNPLPHLSIDPIQDQCAPLSFQIPNNSTGVDTNFWSIQPSANGSFSPADNLQPILTLLDNQSDTIRYDSIFYVATSNFGCVADTSFTVGVIGRPIASMDLDNTTCPYSSLVVVNSSQFGTSYQWTSNFSQEVQITNSSDSIPVITVDSFSSVIVPIVFELTVSNNSLCVDSTTDTVLLIPNAIAEIVASPLIDCAPFVINNTMLSAVDFPDAVDSFLWFIDSGNGLDLIEFTTVPTITWDYTINEPNSGLTVQLVTIGSCSRDTNSIDFTTYPLPIDTFILVPDSICSGETIVAQNSVFSPVSSDSFEWFVGLENTNLLDTVYSTSQDTSFTLTNLTSQDQRYVIALRVTDINNCSSIHYDTVVVHPNPVASFLLDSNAFCAGLTSLSTTGVINNSAGNDLEYLWSVSDPLVEISDDTARTPVFTFPDNQSGTTDTFIIELTVTSSDSCVDFTTQTVYVFTRPVADFSLPTDFCGDDTITAINTSQYGISYLWSADPNLEIITNTADTPQFIFPLNTSQGPQFYTIELSVLSDSLCRDTLVFPVTVQPQPTIIVDSIPDICAPVDTISISNNSLNATTHLWTLSPDTNTSIITNTSDTPVIVLPDLQGNDSLQYTLTYQATSSFECVESYQDTFSVFGRPVASFVPDSGCVGDTLTLVNSSQFASSYTWSTSSTAVTILDSTSFNAEVVLNNNSSNADLIIPIQLIAENGGNCTDLIIDTIVIHPDPVAELSVDTVRGCAGLTIGSSVLSAIDYPDAVDTFVWFIDRGDGLGFEAWYTSEAPDIDTLTDTLFNDGDTVLVRLETRNEHGCAVASDTAVFITYPNPSVAFVLDKDSVCVGDTIEVTSNTSSTNVVGSGVSYNWKVRDIVTNTLITASASTDNLPVFTLPNTSNTTDAVYQITLIIEDTISTCQDSVSETVVIHPEPLASFTLDNNGLCAEPAPLVTTGVSNTSLADTPSYAWTINNGGSISDDTDSLPVFTFPDNQSGVDTTYTVGLTVTSAYGCVHDTTQAIDIFTRPVAGFTINPDTCGVASVRATDTSRYAVGWLWSVSDASVTISDATIQDPEFTFPENDTEDSIVYTITLQVTSADSCTDVTTRTVTIYPQPLVTFSGITDGCGPLGLLLVNGSRPKNGEDSTSMTFRWLIDSAIDGTIEDSFTTVNLNNQFTNGSQTDVPYSVTLVGTTQHGCVEDETQSLVVFPDPVAELSVDTVRGCAGLTIGSSVLSAIDYPDAVDTFVWFIDRGDGLGFEAWYTSEAPDIDTLTDTLFNDGDTVLVRLETRNEHGCAVASDTAVFITYPNPSVAFVLDKDSVCVGDTIEVTSNTSSTNVVGSGVSYNWKVRDIVTNTLITASASTDNLPVFTLPNTSNTTDAVYQITLIIEDTISTCQDSVSETVVIHPEPLASFTLDNNGLCAEPAPLVTTGVSNTSLADTPSYAWTINNGGSISDDTDSLPVFTFPDNQSGVDTTYTVGLTVTSAYGCVHDTTQAIDIFTRPVAGFTINPDTCGVASVRATDTSRYAVGWLWSVSDASVTISDATIQDPEFTFPENDTEDSIVYTITLQVTSADSCTDVTTRTVTIYPQPLVTFSGITDGCGPLGLLLVNGSRPKNGEDSTSMTFRWLIDSAIDGTIEDSFTTVNLNNQFTNGSQTDVPYSVTLVGTTQHGCVEDETQSLVVFPDPVAQVDVVTTLACAPFVINDTVINAIDFPDAVDSFVWYLDTSGTGSSFDSLVYSSTDSAFLDSIEIVNDDDSVTLRLVTFNVHGCNPDTVDVRFVTIEDPVADFTVLDSLCSGSTYAVTNTSNPSSGLTYQWYVQGLGEALGSEGSTTVRDPSFILANDSYNIDTTYEIQLIVTAGSGCTDVTTDRVVVHPVPFVSFVLDSLDLCAVDSPLSVTGLTNNSVVDEDDNPWTWFWTVDNGGIIDTNDIKEPTISFPDNQSGVDTTYTIELFVESQYRCIDSISAPIDVYTRPIAEFSMDSVVCGPDSVSVVNNSSYDTTWSWSVSDTAVVISNASAENPVFIFPENTTQDSINYVVELVAFSTEGCSDTTRQVVTVYPQPLVTFSGITDGCGPLGLLLVNGSRPKNGEDSTSMTFRWLIDSAIDGTIEDSFTTVNLDNLFTNGSQTDVPYSVTLVGTTQHGCVEDETQSLVVFPDPVAEFTSTDTIRCTDTPFVIDDNVITTVEYPDANDVYSWEVDYNDGVGFIALGTGVVFPGSIILAAPDLSITIRLIATNVHGCQQSVFDQVFNTHPDPVAEFELDTNEGCGYELIVNTTNNSSLTGPSANLSYEWFVTAVNGSNTSNAPVSLQDQPTLTLGNSSTVNQDSVYGIRLIAISDAGCRNVSFDTVIVHPLPIADFAFDTICQNNPIGFLDTSIINADSMTEWLWDFGNGASSIEENPTITYSSPGNYNVELDVTNSNRCSDVIIQTVSVNPLPSVNATYLPLVCVQEDIPFTIVNPTPNTIYAWDFESNDTIDSIGPQYSSFIFDGFLSSGPFDVTVYGETAFGCVDSSTFTIRVADALNPNFNLTDNFGCDSLTFAAQPELQGVQNGTLSFQWRINDIIVDDGVGFPTALNYTLYAIPDSTITFDIELRLFSDTCATEARQIQTITLTPTPTIQVNQLPIDSCSQTSPLLPTFINTSVGSPDSFYIFWDNAIPNNGNSTNTQDVGTWDTLQPSPNENLYPAQDPISYINNSNIPLTYLPEFEIFNQCGQDDTTIAITVFPNTVTPEVTAIDDTVCLGDTFEFVSGAFGFGTVEYSFGNGDTFESTADTIRYSYDSAGTYVVTQTVYSPDSCSQESDALTVVVQPTPVADITAFIDTIGCAPLIIDSGDLLALDSPAINNVFIWSLDTLGIGSYDSLLAQGPGLTTIPQLIVLDTAALLYSIQLEVTSVYNCASSFDIIDFSTYDNPAVGFTLDTTEGCGDTILVNATDTSQPTGSGTIIGYEWRVADISIDVLDTSLVPVYSTARDTSFVFTNTSATVDSVYVIALTVFTGDSCASTTTDTVTVHPEPLASFTLDNSGLCAEPAPLVTTGVNNTSSADVPSYAWTIDNGGTINDATIDTPVFTFPDNQSGVDTTYTVGLTVTSAYGCVDSTSYTIDIYTRPVADFTIDPDTCGVASLQATNASSYAVEWLWSVSDDTVTISDDTARNPVFTFPENNTIDSIIYTITLEVRSADSCTDVTTRTVTIYPQPLVTFSGITDSCGPLDLLLVNGSDPYNGELLTSMNFTWLIDSAMDGSIDGTISNIDTPSYVFTNGSQTDVLYSVTLVGETQHGCVEDSTLSLVVFPDPVATIIADTTIACADPVFVIDSSIVRAEDYPAAVDSFAWYIDITGTGNAFDPSPYYSSTDSVFNASYTITNPDDTIVLRLVTFNEHGCIADTAEVVFSAYPDPVADFTVAPLDSCGTPLTVQTSNTSTVANGNGPLTWLWDVRDASNNMVATSTDSDPSFSLTNGSNTIDSVYVLSLTATSIYGCPNTVTDQVIVRPVPLASFTLDNSGLCAEPAPLVTTGVSNTSSADVPSYAWTIDNGGTINDAAIDTPVFTFPDNQSGVDTTYTIGLTVTSAYGCVHDTTQTIDIYTRPVADFTIDPDTCGVASLQATNASSYAVEWLWSVSDDTVTISDDTARNPVFTFPENNTIDSIIYTITLEVRSADSCTDVTTRTVTIYPQPLVTFSGITDSCGPLDLLLVNGSDPYNGELLTSMNFTWLIDSAIDGTIEDSFTTVNLNNQFTNGSQTDVPYSVTLVGETQHGCVEEETQGLVVFPDPVAEFTSTDTIECADPTFVIDDNVITTVEYTDANDVYSWEVNYNDGAGFIALGTGVVFPGSVVIDGPDLSVTIRLIVTNVHGCQQSVFDQVFNTHPDPVAQFTVAPADSCGTPLTVQTSNTSTVANGNGPLTWLWDVRDESNNSVGTSTDSDPSFSLTNSSNTIDSVYVLSLTATSIYGCPNTVTDQVIVRPVPLASFTLDSSGLCAEPAPLVTTGVNNTSSADVPSYAWTIDNGGTINDAAIDTPVFTFPDNQTGATIPYTVGLTVTSAYGCVDSTSDTIDIYTRPIAGFTIDTGGCGPLTLTPSNQTLYSDSVNQVWSSDSASVIFSDINAFDEPGITFPFNGSFTENYYTVNLLSQTVNGCLDTASEVVEILPQPTRIHEIIVEPDSGCQPLIVTVNDSSTAAVYRIWDFGDGTILADTNQSGVPVIHTYLLPGTYNITLQASAFAVCEDILQDGASVDVYIKPTAFFTYEIGDYPLPRGGEITITNLSSDADFYNWDFGDTFTDTAFEPYHRYYDGFGPYDITLYTSTTYGCLDTFVLDVSFPEYIANFIVPNAFSPESGFGEASIFLPKGVGIEEYRFEIYSAWGELIWYTDKVKLARPVEGWDGRDKNGILLPQDTYVWRAYLKFLDGSTWRGQDIEGAMRTEGTLMLIR